MKKLKIFIACDTQSNTKLKQIIKETKTKHLDIGYKIGLEFFLSPSGRKIISKLSNAIAN